MLVTGGQYFNLDYVSISPPESGKPDVWNRDWSYTIGEETTTYEKGQSCGNLGIHWRTIKRYKPELFKHFLLLQQPAAYRDGIVTAWSMEDLQKTIEEDHGGHKVTIVQMHDMVGCQSTAEIKQLRVLLCIFSCLVGADMTARLQLTDLEKARKVHTISWNRQLDIKRWLRRKAMQVGGTPTYVITPLELGMLCEAIQIGLIEDEEKTEGILNTLVATGVLAYNSLKKYNRFFCRWRSLNYRKHGSKTRSSSRSSSRNFDLICLRLV